MNRSPARYVFAAKIPYSGATGAARPVTTACILKPAITRASNIASPMVCNTSNPAHRANTRSAGVSNQPKPGQRTGYPTRNLPMPLMHYLDRERAHTDDYIDAVRDHIPFRRDTSMNESGPGHSLDRSWMRLPMSFRTRVQALTEPNGLLAIGGDLSVKRLLAAYRRGIFPWFSDDQPILWWTPDPRAVLFPTELKISRSLRKTLRKNIFTVSVDQAFADVMAGCADRGDPTRAHGSRRT